MGQSIFNTPDRDNILSAALDIQQAGLDADNAQETPTIVNGDIEHTVRSAYFCNINNTGGGVITITVPHDVDDSFAVYDAQDALVGPDKVEIKLMEADGITVKHTENLQDRNRNWTWFKKGGDWFYIRNDKGELHGPF